MRILVIAYVAAIGIFFLPLACSVNAPSPTMAKDCDPPECVMAMDSMEAEACKPPTCYADPIPPRPR